jgi:hypothetical protein
MPVISCQNRLLFRAGGFPFSQPPQRRFSADASITSGIFSKPGAIPGVSPQSKPLRGNYVTSLTGGGIAAVCLEKTNWWQIIRSLAEVFEAMDHSILSHRDSQHRSQKANLNQFNDQ